MKIPQKIWIKQFKVSQKWNLAAVIVRASFSFCVAVEIFMELAPLKAAARFPPSSVSLAAQDDWHQGLVQDPPSPLLCSLLLSSLENEHWSRASVTFYSKRDAARAQRSLKMATLWIYPSLLFFLLPSFTPSQALRNYPENEGKRALCLVTKNRIN